MPVHDWTCVRPGTFHDFHTSWITHLKESLNDGLLPQGYYAMSEQPAEDTIPDVLTLQAVDALDDQTPESDPKAEGLIAVAEAPPKVALTTCAETEITASKRRTLMIRHATADRVVALVEILSRANKNKRMVLDRFLDKAVSALRQGYHLLVIDLHPPGPHDPDGIHGALWAQIDDASYAAPANRPLTLAAYSASLLPTAYVEPIAVGSVLPLMPLFLDPHWYINVPLEQTYLKAWRGVPQRWRRVIEGTAGR